MKFEIIDPLFAIAADWPRNHTDLFDTAVRAQQMEFTVVSSFASQMAIRIN